MRVNLFPCFYGLMIRIPMIFASLLVFVNCHASTLTVIIPFGTGGGSHQFATTVLDEVRKQFGVTINIINIKGRNGLKGSEHYMSLPPDGNSVLQQVDILSAQYAAGKTKINPAVDLIPVSGPQIVYSQLYISNVDARFHEWNSFLSFGNRFPFMLRISTIGSTDSLEGISMNLLSRSTGLMTCPINFDDPAQRYMALIEGKTDALFEQPGDVAPFLNRKLIKPVLTFLLRKPASFGKTNALSDIKADFKPLLRFRGFFVNPAVNPKKIRRLQMMFATAFQKDNVKRFLKRKYSLDSKHYQGPEGSAKLVRETVKGYKAYFENRQTKETAHEKNPCRNVNRIDHSAFIAPDLHRTQ